MKCSVCKKEEQGLMEDFHTCENCNKLYCDDCEMIIDDEQQQQEKNQNIIKLICYNCYLKRIKIKNEIR